MSSTPQSGDATAPAGGHDARRGGPADSAGSAVGPIADPITDPSADPKARLYDRLPPLPAAVLDPRPALALGTAVWLIVAVILLVADGWSRTVALCFAGVAVGLLGTLVYALQRRAVVRGARGSQQGLDFDRR